MPKPHISPTEKKGIVFWWSTFYQRWNISPWEGIDKLETERFTGKPILSNQRLVKVTTNAAKRIFPDTEGVAWVVEDGYSAIWSSHQDHNEFLKDKIQWLVCNEI